MADRNRNARIACPGVGTLDLPWWPQVSRSGFARTWSEIPRPGGYPLMVSDGVGLAQYVVSYLARDRDMTVSITEHLDLLRQISQSDKAVTFWLGTSNRGQYHVTEVSIEELFHTPTGWPTAADVSFTLKKASTWTVNVGPIKPSRHLKPNQSQSPTR